MNSLFQSGHCFSLIRNPHHFVAALLGMGLGSAHGEISFMKEIAPVVQRRCMGCHGEKKSSGNYRLHTFKYLSQAIVPNQPDESEFYLLLIEPEQEDRMPKEDDALSDQQIQTIRQWIEEGAHFDGVSPDDSFQAQAFPRDHPPAPEQYRLPIPVTALAFSPTGKELAASGYHEVTLWNSENGELLRRFPHLPTRIQALVWSSNGSQLLVGGGSEGEYGEVCWVDTESGNRSKVLSTFEDIVLDVAWAQDGRSLAAVSADRTLKVFDAASGEIRWKTRVHSDWVTSVAFSPDQPFVITGSSDQTVKVLDLETGGLFTTYNGHRRQYGNFLGRFKVYQCLFDPVSQRAVSAGEGNAIRVWDPVIAKEENGTAGDMEERFFNAGHTRYIPHSLTGSILAMELAGNTLYVAGTEGVVQALNFESGEGGLKFEGKEDWVYALSHSPTQPLLASGSHDGEVRIWDTQSGELRCRFDAAPGYSVKIPSDP